MDLTPPLTFGACSLDLRRRELRREGVLQEVPPKVFDLLVLLVDRRHRVVTKDELQTALWLGQPVTDGAIARTVMQARKALGDAALIKTVHGVGYRFVGETLSASGPPAATSEPGVLRLALLPVTNGTGVAHHDWAELGLAAIAIQALDNDPRLSVVGLPELLAVLPPSASARERVEAATQLLGLQGCVQAQLRSQGSALWLDYQGHGERMRHLVGSLRGDEPAELGERLAQEIREALAPGAKVAASRVSQDPFIHQAFARAAQMLALHQFRPAAKLLAVVIEFEPDSLAARLAHVHALANLEDPGADALACELADLAAARGDTRTQARALSAAGGALALAEGEDGLALAARRLEAALALAAAFDSEDWAVRIRLVSGWVALLRGELKLARHHYAFVEQATAPDNQFQLALALDGRAALECECGEHLKVQGLLERSAQIYLRHKMHSTAALTLMNLALACLELGQVTRALEHARHSESLFDRVQQPHVAATIAESASKVYAELGLADELVRVLRRLAPPDGVGAKPAKGQWPAARGLLAQCAGRPDEARQHLAQALAMAEAAGSPVRCARRSQQALELEMHAGSPAQLAQARTRAEALLKRYDDTALRAVLDRAEAAQRLDHGDAEGALAALRRAIDITKPGRVHALSRLDAAWLLADASCSAEASALVRPVGPWLEEHPLGRALARRLADAGAPAPARGLPSLRALA